MGTGGLAVHFSPDQQSAPAGGSPEFAEPIRKPTSVKTASGYMDLNLRNADRTRFCIFATATPGFG
jgi:hypothetical protein